MGMWTSREKYLEQEKRRLEDRITLRFPSFKETDEKILMMQAQVNKVVIQIPDIVRRLSSFTGLQQAINPILSVINSAFLDSSVEAAMLTLKIEKAVVSTVHILIETEMKSVARQLKLINDKQLSREEKKIHLAIADHTSYQLLAKFGDEKFYLKKYPLVFTPFLMSFVAVYAPIAIANYQVVGTNRMREDCKVNIQQLKDIVIYFKEQSLNERLQYIEENSVYDTYTEVLMFVARRFSMPFVRPVYSELRSWYCKETTKKYEEYFEPVLQALQQINF